MNSCLLRVRIYNFQTAWIENRGCAVIKWQSITNRRNRRIPASGTSNVIAPAMELLFISICSTCSSEFLIIDPYVLIFNWLGFVRIGYSLDVVAISRIGRSGAILASPNPKEHGIARNCPTGKRWQSLFALGPTKGSLVVYRSRRVTLPYRPSPW